MKVKLIGHWNLSNERAESYYGLPVLVNDQTGEAYGPGDIIEPLPNWGLKPARLHIKRMVNMAGNFNKEDMAFINLF